MKRPQTVVKELREWTAWWGERDPTTQEAMRMGHVMREVKALIDQLPSFRVAPQTPLDNAVRAIEAIYRAQTNTNLRREEFRPSLANPNIHGDRNMRIVLAVATIINTLHKVGLPEPYEGQVYSAKTDPDSDQYEEPDEHDDDDEDDDEGVVENTDEPVPVEAQMPPEALAKLHEAVMAYPVVPPPVKPVYVKLDELKTPEYQNDKEEEPF